MALCSRDVPFAHFHDPLRNPISQLVLLLTFFLAVILMRVLKKDFARYMEVSGHY